MIFNNQTRKYEIEDRDLNVGCLYCEKALKAKEIDNKRCSKCGLNLRVEFLRKDGMLFMGVDEKISQFKVRGEK